MLLRRPEERAASHFKMLVKLARRGEEWAQVRDRVRFRARVRFSLGIARRGEE